MKQVTIHEAKTHLSRLIQEAIKGEQIIIARGSTPLVELRVLPSARTKRTPGVFAGLDYWMSEDFGEPLEDFKDYMQ